MAAQPSFDVVVTNTLLVLDDARSLHPHSAMRRASVAGMSASSPFRSALDGQAILASTFSFDTDIPDLSNVSSGSTAEEKAEALGVVLIAHELGHAYFGIPDVYDHGPECLMTSRLDENYSAVLEALRRDQDPCPRCMPYVYSRSLLEGLRRDLTSGGNRALFSRAMSLAKYQPTRFHGRNRRSAILLALMSEGRAALGDPKGALVYAERALEYDPQSPEARGVWARFVRSDGSTPPSPRR